MTPSPTHRLAQLLAEQTSLSVFLEILEALAVEFGTKFMIELTKVLIDSLEDSLNPPKAE
jgi:hypothetical protein